MRLGHFADFVVVLLVRVADVHARPLAISTDASGRLAVVEREASELRDENDTMKEQITALQRDLERLRESFQTCVLTVSTHKTNVCERLSQHEEIQQTLHDKVRLRQTRSLLLKAPKVL